MPASTTLPQFIFSVPTAIPGISAQAFNVSAETGAARFTKQQQYRLQHPMPMSEENSVDDSTSDAQNSWSIPNLTYENWK